MSAVTGLDELFAIHSDALLLIDATGRVTRANGIAHELFRCPDGTLVGALIGEFVPARLEHVHAAHVHAFFERPIARRMGEGRILEAQRRDGTRFDVDVALAPMGERVLAIVRDMTAAREQARETRDQVERERIIRELANVGTWELDVATDRRTFSRELLHILGLAQEPATSAEFFALVHPDDRARMRVRIETAFLTGRGYELLSRIRNAAGEWRWIESRVTVDAHASGAARAMRGVVMDVTDAIASRQRLAEREAQLQSIIDAAPARFVVVDRAGTVRYAGAAPRRPPLFGDAGASAFDVLDDGGAARLREAIDAASRAESVARCDLELSVDGVRRCHSISARRMPGDDARVLLVARDVTEQRLAEREGIDLRAAMEHAVEGVARVDRDGRISKVNAAYARALGVDPGALVGADWLDTFLEHDRAAVKSAVASMTTTGRAEIECVARRADGTTFDRHATLVAASAPGDGFHCFMQDVTERRQVREQLAIAERMASVGSLAAGVAHEINNPLTAILSNVDLALESLSALANESRLPQLDRLRAPLADVRDAAERTRRIVRDLVDFSRDEPAVGGAVDAARVADASARMADNLVRHRARFVRDYRPSPLVAATDSRLGQVLLNLIVNAAQAIPEGHVDAHEIRVKISPFDADTVGIEVSDTGEGMTDETRARLFSPFFTTKPLGSGTGLGLSICYGIVRSLGGRIEVESAVGRGSTFRVILPSARGADREPAPAVAMAPMEPTRRAKVLVVDDEPAICVVCARALGGAHDVVATHSPTEALARIERGERYDVIFCDLMMPMMSGAELYERIRIVAPEQADRVTFLTGGAFTPALAAFVERVRHRCLAKPFEIDAIRTIVAAATRAGVG